MFVVEESEVKEIRMSRLSEDEQDEYRQVNQSWADGDKTAVNRMVELLDKADDYDAMPTEGLQIEADAEQNRLVWSEAKELRSNGDLLRLAASIKCPVVAIHGDHDPHPYKPVFEPLSANITDFESHLLEKCGHTPWREKHARDLFFGILRNQVGV
jgi:pimeloyl-ACP methyl ester carboxylesterase